MNTATHTIVTPALEPVRDSSGYRIFSAGELGEAHSMAHQMLDRGLPELGHARLGRWLEGRVGQGSRWVHLQWHMMVFELAVGDLESARDRYMREIFPVAASTQDALVDAPAGLWRLLLASPEPIALPWNEVADTACAALREATGPYVRLHCLLALAGVGDVAAIDRWIAQHIGDSHRERVLGRMALALRCFAAGDYGLAASAFAIAVPDLAVVGGSRAQNELFADIHRLARRLAATASTSDTLTTIS
jgi:hypothetical protein